MWAILSDCSINVVTREGIVMTDVEVVVKNIGFRSWSLTLNGARTIHMPPGHSLTLPEAEIVNNAMAEKLKHKKLLEVQPLKAKAGGKESRAAGAKPSVSPKSSEGKKESKEPEPAKKSKESD